MTFADDTEPALLAQAAAFAKYRSLVALSPAVLREISATNGLDFATALLYDRVKNSPDHAAFIEQIETLRGSKTREHAGLRSNPVVAIVPAALYRQTPGSGADGRVVREAVEAMGLRSELIPVGSTGTLADNSKMILEWLQHHAEASVILVSLCKGSADVKFALDRAGEERGFSRVQAWLNICGTPNGSPIAHWLLASKPRAFATWLLLKSRGHNDTFLREIVPSATGPLSGPIRLPATLPLINVVGFPLRRHLSNAFMRRCHRILASQGPNDGGVLLGESCRFPGLIYPVWAADHYLRPEERAREIITALLRWTLRECTPSESARKREELCPGKQIQGTGQSARTLSV